MFHVFNETRAALPHLKHIHNFSAAFMVDIIPAGSPKTEQIGLIITAYYKLLPLYFAISSNGDIIVRIKEKKW